MARRCRILSVSQTDLSLPSSSVLSPSLSLIPCTPSHVYPSVLSPSLSLILYTHFISISHRTTEANGNTPLTVCTSSTETTFPENRVDQRTRVFTDQVS